MNDSERITKTLKIEETSGGIVEVSFRVLCGGGDFCDLGKKDSDDWDEILYNLEDFDKITKKVVEVAERHLGVSLEWEEVQSDYVDWNEIAFHKVGEENILTFRCFYNVSKYDDFAEEICKRCDKLFNSHPTLYCDDNPVILQCGGPISIVDPEEN